jgi:hypothetical protein
VRAARTICAGVLMFGSLAGSVPAVCDFAAAAWQLLSNDAPN